MNIRTVAELKAALANLDDAAIVTLHEGYMPHGLQLDTSDERVVICIGDDDGGDSIYE